MLPVGIGSSGVDVGDIGHSLRFAASRSCYASRTFGTATNQYIFTWSGWVKLSGLDTTDYGELIECRSASSDAGYGSLYVYNGNIRFSGWAKVWRTTTMELRDPSSWYHIVLAVDTTQATAANRIKLYVNGVEVTSFTTSNNPTQNTTVGVNTNSSAARIGSDDPLSSSRKLDGYLSRVCFVDGQALTPSSFITFNSTINEWVSKTQSEVKAVVDAGGTNSFMLDFDDGSSTTTLGYDKSSKGNNWTLSGHSLTAGTNYDWMLDVPGNSFPVINSLVPVNSTAPTISDANLKWTRASTAPGWTAASMPLPQTDKLYWETDHTSSLNGAPLWTGVVNSTRAVADDNANNIAGVQTDTTWNGRLTSGSTVASYLNPGGLNAVIAHAYDGATGKYWCGYVSGGSITWGTNGGVGDPAAGTNALETLSGVVTPAFGQFQTAGATRTITEYFNAGQRPFSASALPTGFKALCQANLSDSGTVTVSGSFTGNLNADGPCVWMNGVPKTLSINGNAVTFGTHADKLATGFKVRTASSSYNNSGSNTFTATIDSDLQNIFKYNNAEGNP